MNLGAFSAGLVGVLPCMVPAGVWFTRLVTRIAATSKSQIASDCNRNSRKITQKYASGPHPHIQGKNMNKHLDKIYDPKCFKTRQNLAVWVILLFLFLPCMWGLGLQKRIPNHCDSETPSEATSLDSGFTSFAWFYSVSEVPHGSGNPPEYVATTRV